MKRIILLVIITIILAACSTVPITGRRQLNIIPDSTMLSMSFSQYDQFLKEHKLSKNKKQIALVKKVGNRIKNAVEKYMKEHGLEDRLANYNWEFNLVEDSTPNAWCMPGGKVVVYTGILPLTKDETGLAVVLGHEIAHAVAEHGSERMSQQMLVQMGGTALAAAMKTKPAETQQLWMQVYGLGAQYGALLPYSRLHESEADRLGLIFMAIAGYDPRAAIPFWKRMSALSKGNAPPEFLSTHPADATRIEDIKKELPEALKYYKKNH